MPEKELFAELKCDVNIETENITEDSILVVNIDGSFSKSLGQELKDYLESELGLPCVLLGDGIGLETMNEQQLIELKKEIESVLEAGG